ncbi:DUF2854 domain-containing protein [Chrysosporum bergii ANA360D]|jgi:hypothetical protein|uniref:DUF2854 domain-containing protein n=1 Tax=Chrysosporum bergii ANA360D TaxID=617107 RepID=A0AA43GQJ4_9CYAN|nr:DUF2854 domain-containing protein [Chrysosporum bergii]MDH6059695.1 DUF2854 domain-containing protein [Chrysosporum bergii ANA360D]
MFRKISLGTIGLSVGGVLVIVGFAAYAADNATLNLVGFFYGFPLFLGGLALKANEIPPAPFSEDTTPSVSLLREQQATVTQNKIRQDVTRYCYGKEGHLDETLDYLGLSPTDEERPVLISLREAEINGGYALVLLFDSPFISFDDWQEKQEKMTKYFGPGVDIKITEVEEDMIELSIISG